MGTTKSQVTMFFSACMKIHSKLILFVSIISTDELENFYNKTRRVVMLFFNGNDGSKIENIISNNLIQTNDIFELKRKVKLAKGQEKVDLVVKNANIPNVFSGDIHETVLLLLMESLWDLERGMWPKILMMLKENSCVLNL